MSLEKSLKKIKIFLKDRYKDNLAAILIFGSANTGQYKEGKSDIDIIVLLKEKDKINLKEEFKNLEIELKNLRVSLHHLKTIKEYEKYIYDRGSWSSWIDVIKATKRIYSTKEFSKFRGKLIKKPISKSKLIEYSNYKNKRIDNYLVQRKGFSLTKGVFANLRARMQAIIYMRYKKIIFDYNKCLRRINLGSKEKEMLKKIYNKHQERKNLTKREFQYYQKLIKKLTNTIY